VAARSAVRWTVDGRWSADDAAARDAAPPSATDDRRHRTLVLEETARHRTPHRGPRTRTAGNETLQQGPNEQRRSGLNEGRGSRDYD